MELCENCFGCLDENHNSNEVIPPKTPPSPEHSEEDSVTTNLLDGREEVVIGIQDSIAGPVPRFKSSCLITGSMDDSVKTLELKPSNAPALMKQLKTIAQAEAQIKEENLLHIKFVVEVIQTATRIMSSCDSLVDIPVPPGYRIVICGDTHGYYNAVTRVFRKAGFPHKHKQTIYLFNGDVVDRGPRQFELLLLLLFYKATLPKRFFINRGNHESLVVNCIYGFMNDLEDKAGPYRPQLVGLIRDLYQSMPIASVVGGKIWVSHGGLPGPSTTLEEVRQLPRIAEFCLLDEHSTFKPPQGQEKTVFDILWSDPGCGAGLQPNRIRGCSFVFGPDITKAFLELNKLEFVVRSHQLIPKGYEIQHDHRCITLFTACNYCNRMNTGAFLVLRSEDLDPSSPKNVHYVQ